MADVEMRTGETRPKTFRVKLLGITSNPMAEDIEGWISYDDEPLIEVELDS